MNDADFGFVMQLIVNIIVVYDGLAFCIDGSINSPSYG